MKCQCSLYLWKYNEWILDTYIHSSTERSNHGFSYRLTKSTWSRIVGIDRLNDSGCTRIPGCERAGLSRGMQIGTTAWRQVLTDRDMEENPEEHCQGGASPNLRIGTPAPADIAEPPHTVNVASIPMSWLSEVSAEHIESDIKALRTDHPPQESENHTVPYHNMDEDFKQTNVTVSALLKRLNALEKKMKELRAESLSIYKLSDDLVTNWLDSSPTPKWKVVKEIFLYLFPVFNMVLLRNCKRP